MTLQEERSIQQKSVKYTHLAELKQEVEHVHKISQKLAQNIFGMNMSDVKYGQEAKMRVTSKDGITNDLDIVYLGGDKTHYMMNSRQAMQSVKTELANRVIGK